MKRILILVAVATLAAHTTSAQVNAKYQGEVNAGYSIGIGPFGMNRVNLHTVQGVKIGDYVSTGLGIGLDWWRGLYADYWEEQGKADMGELSLPIYLNVKSHLPISETTAPYLTFDIGYNVGLTDGLEGFGGLYLTPGVGVKIGMFKAEVGFNIQKIDTGLDILDIKSNAIKLAVGVVF